MIDAQQATDTIVKLNNNNALANDLIPKIIATLRLAKECGNITFPNEFARKWFISTVDEWEQRFNNETYK